ATRQAANSHKPDLTLSMRISPADSPGSVHASTADGLRRPPSLDMVFACQNPLERQSFMTRFRVACCLALAVFGLGASAASAQNVPATATVQATAPDAEPKSSRPAPNEPREAPAASVAPAVSVVFGANSAEISDRAKADLDRVAKTISEQRMPQVELRAFAGGD